MSEEAERYRDIVLLGVEMRRLQTAYFKSRDFNDLTASKAAEKRFDAAAKDMDRPRFPDFIDRLRGNV